MNKFKPIPDDFRWSFSKLESFCTCPRMFALQHLKDPPIPDNGNAWSEYGTLCHSLLEEWAKNELPDFCLAEEYDKRYGDVIVHSFPPFRNYAAKTYEQGLEYFRNFDGFGNIKILSVEEKFTLSIAGNTFVGIADLVYEDVNTGDIILIDHKTKSPSSMKKDFGKYRRQLYIYAAHIHQKFGRFPKKLMFNLIKNGTMIAEEFNQSAYDETMRWIEETIMLIQMESEFKPTPSEFFCSWLCNCVDECPRGQNVWNR